MASNLLSALNRGRGRSIDLWTRLLAPSVPAIVQVWPPWARKACIYTLSFLSVTCRNNEPLSIGPWAG